jgi:uncharacterized protein (TIGR03118 family)
MLPASSRADPYFLQTNLVTDDPTLVPDAKFVDSPSQKNLVNPWGITYGGKGPFWVSDNNSGLSTLYTGQGVKIPLGGNGITIPPATGQTTGSPTGIVFNPTAKAGGFKHDAFIFVSEDGTISGWRGGGAAVPEILGDAANTNVYKGLAIAKNGNSTFIYATNFKKGQVEVYDSTFTMVNHFTDPTVPAGYAPFGIQAINGKLYVTFALQNDAKHDDVAGAGHGFVDIFEPDGTMDGRLISQGKLNSPWGLALAPSTFKPFGGDLLVGNFGDSTINAFDPVHGTYLGTLSDKNGNPLVLTVSPSGDPTNHKGLWGLIFGNNGAAGSSTDLFFTSGINDEGDGLFGQIQSVPEPGTTSLVLIGLVSLGAFRWWKTRKV